MTVRSLLQLGGECLVEAIDNSTRSLMTIDDWLLAASSSEVRRGLIGRKLAGEGFFCELTAWPIGVGVRTRVLGSGPTSGDAFRAAVRNFERAVQDV